MVNLKGKMRGQAAMEYLMTYGWALLVIVIVIAILLIINPFSAPQGCRFDDLGFSCSNPVADSSGQLYVRVTNGQSSNIKVAGVVCTTDRTPNAPQNTGQFSGSLLRQEYADIKGICCEPSGCSAGSLNSGQDFSGKIWVFWQTDDEASAGYPVYHTSSASFVTKVGATA